MSAERGGGSWWGRRWVDELERLSTSWQSRLNRGQDYANKGHVLSLNVSAGRIAAKVQGSRSKPYTTNIEVATNKESDWETLIRELAQQARYPALLLSSEMPEDIEDLFRKSGLSLFPQRNSELIGTCSCPDKGRPCKHIAAVHFAFGEALDRDPFLLFQLRGADRDTLLRGFQSVWFGRNSRRAKKREKAVSAADAKGERIMPLSADRFNRAGGPDHQIAFHVAPPDSPLLVLARLGPPRPWTLPIAPEDLLGPVYEEARGLALDFALELETARVDDDDDDELDASLEDLDDEDDEDDDEDDASGAHESVEDEELSFVELKQRASTPERAAKRERAQESAVTQKPDSVKRRPAGGDRLKSMLGDALPTPSRTAPVSAQQNDSSDDESERGVLIRRGNGAGPIRRSKKGRRDSRLSNKRAVAVDNGARADDAATAAEATERAIAAWKDNDMSTALDAAREAWRAEYDEGRMLLLISAADAVEQSAAVVDEEVQRIERRADMLPALITVAELLMLVSGGRWAIAAKVVQDRVALGVEIEDEVVHVFLDAALLALTGATDVPEASSLASSWERLFKRGEDLFGELDEPPAPVGAWVQWSLEANPPDEDALLALQDAAADAALALLASRGARTGPERAKFASELVASVAEALTLRDEHQAVSVFLHRVTMVASDHGPLTQTLHEALGDSSVLPDALVVTTMD